MNISIIGTGNVATVFAKLAYRHKYNIVQIIGRNESEGTALAKTVSATFTNLQEEIWDVDLIIIAVSDNALPILVDELNLPQTIIVHTAGSVSINIFKDKIDNYGVLYPLQSLRKNMVAFPAIPLLIEANNENTFAVIETFAKALSPIVKPITEKERLSMHIAAVFANNFTNYIYAETYQFCEAEKLDFNLLMPLIKETADRIDGKSPLEMQTGPAKRSDSETMVKHLQVLDNYKIMTRLYFLLSDGIKKMFTGTGIGE